MACNCYGETVKARQRVPLKPDLEKSPPATWAAPTWATPNREKSRTPSPLELHPHACLRWSPACFLPTPPPAILSSHIRLRRNPLLPRRARARHRTIVRDQLVWFCLLLQVRKRSRIESEHIQFASIQ